MSKRDEKRQDLKARIIEAAERRIEERGVESLRARDIMSDVGAALGGLYNVFSDLDDLVLQINSRTLARLKAALEQGGGPEGDPQAALTRLALAYASFARTHPRLWSALFQHRFAAGRPIPDWHMAEQGELLAYLARALRPLQPELSEAALALRARTLFGALHGIVETSLAERFVGVGELDLEREIEAFIALLTRGMAA